MVQWMSRLGTSGKVDPVVRKANKSYPATVTLGLDVAYRGARTLLHKEVAATTGEVDARARPRTSVASMGQDVHLHGRKAWRNSSAPPQKPGAAQSVQNSARNDGQGRVGRQAAPPLSTLLRPCPTCWPFQHRWQLRTEGPSCTASRLTGTTQPGLVSTILRDQEPNHVLEPRTLQRGIRSQKRRADAG